MRRTLTIYFMIYLSKKANFTRTNVEFMYRFHSQICAFYLRKLTERIENKTQMIPTVSAAFRRPSAAPTDSDVLHTQACLSFITELSVSGCSCYHFKDDFK